MAERQHSEPKSGRSAKLGLGQALEEATRPKDQAAEVSLVEVTKGVVTAASTTPLVTWTIVEEISKLFGGRKVIGSSIKSELDAHTLLRRGLPRGALTSLIDKLHVIQFEEASEALGVSVGPFSATKPRRSRS